MLSTLLSFLLLADAFLFTSFRGNGESGMFYALSTDGYKWEAVNGDKSVLPCEHEGQLMRDPYIVKGPDGTWHLLWTWGWRRDQMKGKLQIGHATSKDLVTWSSQDSIEVWKDRPEVRNAWAPEMVWDEKQKHWIVFFASTVKADGPYDHRHYFITTADFKTFTEPRLYYDPGFNSIDASVFRNGSQWTMVFKDEREQPVMKALRLSFANSPAGPWSTPTDLISDDWVEGPSPIKIGDWWYVYFDHYRQPHYYGAIRSKDLKQWEDVSQKMSFPAGHRHGTVVRIDARDAKRLREFKR